MQINDILDGRLRAGLEGQALMETRVTGGAKATGKIKFTANPTEDDTITVGDVTLTFKDSADSGEDEVEIGTDLSGTIDAIITKLGTYTTGWVPEAAFTKTGTNTELTATFKTYEARGNEFDLASSAANGVVTAMAGGVDGVLADDVAITYFDDTTLADHQYFTLPDGQEGQSRLLLLGARTNAKNIVVAPKNGASSTYTFDAANEYQNLVFLDGKWRSVGGTATAA
jgi:hypothetical protein